MRFFHWPAVVLLVSLLGVARSDDSPAELLKELRAIGKEGPNSPTTRAAWDKLVARGTAVLPQILEAMDTPDTVQANWLRTAYDRIVVNARQSKQKIDADALLAFVKDPKRQGRARRLALDVVEELRPGTSVRLIPGWLDDPEFRYDAVADLIKQADALDKDNKKDQTIAGYRKAFAACRDVPQAQALALKLKPLDVPVSVAEHFGFLTDWYVIGPFDGRNLKGFKAVYPPETKVDLSAELPGKDGKLKWKRYQVKESWVGLPARAALVNLLEPLGQHEDAVAYAYTTFLVPEAREVEFRGAADDNLSAWVNGQRLFGFDEYRNGVRLDRHRFRANLKAGVNTLLVKVCQAPLDETNPEPNWEFLLRVVDTGGGGLTFKSALPAQAK